MALMWGLLFWWLHGKTTSLTPNPEPGESWRWSDWSLLVAAWSLEALRDGEHLELGEGTRVVVGERHWGDLQGEFNDGLRTTTGLTVSGETSGEGMSLMHGECSTFGLGSRGGDVSSRMAWLLTSTFNFELCWKRDVKVKEKWRVLILINPLMTDVYLTLLNLSSVIWYFKTLLQLEIYFLESS